MDNIWEYIFTNELRVEPSEHYIMISDSPMNPKIKKNCIKKCLKNSILLIYFLLIKLLYLYILLVKLLVLLLI